MSKIITNQIISTRSKPGEYYIRDKVGEFIYPDVIESECKKCEKVPYHTSYFDAELFKENLHTPATHEVNICYLEEKFAGIPDEVKQLMDISTYLTETLKTYSTHGESSFGSDCGTASFSYKQTSTLCGILTIYFIWSRHDEMGSIDWEEDETHIIPAVIYQNHKYYALTKPFIDWLRTPDKPKRQAFLNELFYQ